MHIDCLSIARRAEQIVRECNSRDPFRIAHSLGVQILERNFVRQLGVYKPVLGIPFIFVKADLDSMTKKVVLLHELGHHVLHHDEAQEDEVFSELRLFSLQNNRMEYEANLFAAQIALPDEEFLELINCGYSVEQVAGAVGTDQNLVALKVKILNQRGFDLNTQEFNSKFLKK